MENETSKKKNFARIKRYEHASAAPPSDDPTSEYINLVSMILSMCGLLLKIKWCAWASVFGALVSFANSRSSEDGKQIMSSFMLSVSSVVMTYLNDPAPMNPPW